MTKEVDFETAVRGGHYSNSVDEFMEDLAEYLKDLVPDQYIGGVVARAWEEGHSSGLCEVVTTAMDLADIFRAKPTKPPAPQPKQGKKK